MISRGDVWWADLPDPVGSGPGFRRPVVVVQGDSINRSLIATVVCVPLTSNLKWAKAPGNVSLTQAMTGLPKDSVANVNAIVSEWPAREALLARISQFRLENSHRTAGSR